MTIVIDTNVLISAQLNNQGNESRLLDLWHQGKFEVAVSEPILSEYHQVLCYPRIQKRLGWPDKKITQFISHLRTRSRLVSGEITINAVQDDPTDNKLLACAVEAQADALVTGDKKHLLPIGSFQGVGIITPRTCLNRLAPESSPPPSA